MMNDDTRAPRVEACEHCPRPKMNWWQAKYALREQVENYIKDVEDMAAKGDAEGNEEFNTAELGKETMHEHLFVKALVSWYAAKELLDVKSIIELLAQMVRVNITVVVPPLDSHAGDDDNEEAKHLKFPIKH